MKKTIIGIIGRSFSKNGESVIEVNDDYRLAIVKADGVPIIIVPPNNFNYGEETFNDIPKLTEEDKKNIYQILSLCDGILMTGGSYWYEFDELICCYAVKHNIPILGICLGMQILGSIDSFCGTYHSDKTIKNDTTIEHYQLNIPYVHNCFIQDGLLHDILKSDIIRVNSRHHYHIVKKEYFVVDAYSEDGLIEAIHIPKHKFALGVQWHPESMLSYDSSMQKIFNSFIKATIRNNIKKNH